MSFAWLPQCVAKSSPVRRPGLGIVSPMFELHRNPAACELFAKTPFLMFAD
jgi:hypothetical protein